MTCRQRPVWICARLRSFDANCRNAVSSPRKHWAKSPVLAPLCPPGPSPIPAPPTGLFAPVFGSVFHGITVFSANFRERKIVDPETLEEITDIRPDIITEIAFAVEARPGQQIRSPGHFVRDRSAWKRGGMGVVGVCNPRWLKPRWKGTRRAYTSATPCSAPPPVRNPYPGGGVGHDRLFQLFGVKQGTTTFALRDVPHQNSPLTLVEGEGIPFQKGAGPRSNPKPPFLRLSIQGPE